MTALSADCIFVWHAVMGAPDEAFGALTTPTAEFLVELDAIASGYDIVPLRDLVSADRTAPAGRRPRAALTFDDGLDCQARNAVPALESRGLSYTLCIPLESINSGRPLWNTLLRVCILTTSAPSIDLGWMSIDLSSPAIDRDAVAREVQDLLLSMTEPAWRGAIDGLYRQCADVLDDSLANETIRPMDWAQIQALDPTLCEVASHSRLHRPAVQGDSFESLLADARSSREEIERRLRRPCTAYCFPFGLFTPDSVEAARRAGYTTLLTTSPVPVGAMSGGLEGRFAGGRVHSMAARPG